jgi:DNA-binding NtrC family response regulator
MDLLLEYSWPGNVRELINALQFAAVRCSAQEISDEHLPPEVRQNIVQPPRDIAHTINNPQFLQVSRKTRKKLDVELVSQALNQTGGNKVQAAKLLGVGRATLYRFLNDNPL